MSLYAVTSAIYEDDEQIAYVQFWDDLLDRPVRLWHLQPECWSVEVLITRKDKVIDAVVEFDDFELDYIYHSKHSSESDFTITMPLYFEYPFKVEKELRLMVSIDELKQLPLPGFKTVTY